MNSHNATYLSLNRSTTKTPVVYPAKILQFGGGNFLRAFVDWMVEELNVQTDFNGSVIVVKPTEKGDYAALRAQEGLFHVLTNGIQNGELVSKNQLIQCISKIIHPYREWATFLKTAEESSLRFVVSNTTEAGIRFVEEANDVDQTPVEFPGKLTRWLHHRFRHFAGSEASGMIILPCELIESNGEALQTCILKYADHWNLGTDFQSWIARHNIFCNTLVDRIVPGFPESKKEFYFETLGFKDDLLVTAEPYHIWAIQSPKPIETELPFSKTSSNVVFIDDLAPFRKLKVSILNGAHTSMVPIGYLNGIETVRAAIEDEFLSDFIKKILFDEIIPVLDFPKEETEQYAKDTLDRFRNPFIHHQLISIALNSIAKFKTRVLPSLLGYYDKFGKLPPNIVTAFANLIWFYRGKRGKETIPLKDSRATLDFFKDIWNDHQESKITTDQLVETVLKNIKFWEQDLSQINGLKESLVQILSYEMSTKS